uniref:Rel homology dimerisation domain-containing protein n=3 Tax=Ciona intestinalis TaxID=7719 RepID=H2Y0S5_CIOIN
MFIIGRNFHRGIKVVFQDPEETDGSHWQTTGQLDKDTFNQSHMVVRVPAYHDPTITKPINVQVYVEHNGRKCDPHSFTYDPLPPAIQPSTAENMSCETNIRGAADPVKAILEGKLDKKLLEALFARLLTSTDVDTKDVKPLQKEKELAIGVTSAFNPIQPQANPAVLSQPLSFTTGVPVFGQVSKPVPTQSVAGSAMHNQGLLKPNTFTLNHSLLTSVKPTPLFSNTNNSSFVTSQPLNNAGDQMKQTLFQNPENTQNFPSSTPGLGSFVIKTENPSSEPGFPNQPLQVSNTTYTPGNAATCGGMCQNYNPAVTMSTQTIAHSNVANSMIPQVNQDGAFFKLSSTTNTSAGQQNLWQQQTNTSIADEASNASTITTFT